eukprot:4771033-Pyramimonas_sp.AAC.1
MSVPSPTYECLFHCGPLRCRGRVAGGVQDKLFHGGGGGVVPANRGEPGPPARGHRCRRTHCAQPPVANGYLIKIGGDTRAAREAKDIYFKIDFKRSVIRKFKIHKGKGERWEAK